MRVDPNITVRGAEAGDYAAIAEMMAAAFRYHGSEMPLSPAEAAARLRRELADGHSALELMIAEGPDGEPLGFAWFYGLFWTAEFAPVLYLKELFVPEAARGTGVGGAFMRALAALCVERGWTRMMWTVDQSNEMALGFYAGIAGVERQSKDSMLLRGEALMTLAGER